jgi:hypothetical protein
MSCEEVSLSMDPQAEQLEDITNDALASQIIEKGIISTPDLIAGEIKLLDGKVVEGNEESEVVNSSQPPTPSKRKFRRNKFCNVAKKCWTGVKKGVSVVVDGLYRFFDGKMTVILRGMCYVVWIALGVLLTIAAGVFSIACCAAACVR